MDTKKLRQKILDLAIHGKLVPQDPNDEPASVLLERISKEKERLIKVGKIKRSKQAASSELSPDDVPFELPEGWCTSTLREVFNLQAGKNVSANDIHEFSSDTPYPCYGGNGIRGYVRGYNCDGQFPIIGRQGALCGNINFAQGKFYATEHAIVVTCFADTDVLWSRYILEAMYLNQYATATAQPGLSVATINEVQILLPPYNEQQRIASAVEQWMSVIDVLENNEEDLRQSIDKAKSKILDLAIRGKLLPQDSNDEPASELLKRLGISTDNCPCEDLPFELPNSWCWTTLGNIFQHNTGKALNKSTKQEGELLPYITTSNVYWNRFELKDVRQMYFKEKEIEKCTVRKGDLLICEGGDIGRSAIWSYDYNICIQNHIHRLRPKFDVSVKFYYYVMMLYKRQNSIEGKGIGMLGLSSGLLDKIMFPLPPLAEQHRIVAKIEQLFSQLDEIESSLQ